MREEGTSWLCFPQHGHLCFQQPAVREPWATGWITTCYLPWICPMWSHFVVPGALELWITQVMYSPCEKGFSLFQGVCSIPASPAHIMLLYSPSRSLFNPFLLRAEESCSISSLLTCGLFPKSCLCCSARWCVTSFLRWRGPKQRAELGIPTCCRQMQCHSVTLLLLLRFLCPSKLLLQLFVFFSLLLLSTPVKIVFS